jgi:hypothetical protein
VLFLRSHTLFSPRADTITWLGVAKAEQKNEAPLPGRGRPKIVPGSRPICSPNRERVSINFFSRLRSTSSGQALRESLSNRLFSTVRNVETGSPSLLDTNAAANP